MPRKSKEEETGNEEHKQTLDDIEYNVDLACIFIINTNTNEVITYFYSKTLGSWEGESGK